MTELTWALTAVGLADTQKYPQEPMSCTGPTWWSLLLGLVWARRVEEEPGARCWSDAVLQNTLARCWWRGSSWWSWRRCKHQDPGLQWPATLRHRRRAQTRSRSGVDAVLMRTKGLRSWQDSAATGLLLSTLKPRQCRRKPAVRDYQLQKVNSTRRFVCRSRIRVAWDDDV